MRAGALLKAKHPFIAESPVCGKSIPAFIVWTLEHILLKNLKLMINALFHQFNKRQI